MEDYSIGERTIRKSKKGNVYEVGVPLDIVTRAKIRSMMRRGATRKEIRRETLLDRRTILKYIRIDTLEHDHRMGIQGRPKGQSRLRCERSSGIIRMMFQNPTMTNRRAAQILSHRLGVVVTEPNLSKIRRNLKIYRTRRTPEASQRNSLRVRTACRYLQVLMRTIPREQVVWVDEVHVVSENMFPRYYYHQRGTPKRRIVLPFIPNINVTFIVAMSWNGVSCIHMKDNAVSACNSFDYIRFLRSVPRDQHTVFFHDNSRLHTSRVTRDFITNAGLTVVRNAPFSPRFQAIELLFQVVKMELRSTWRYGVHNINQVRERFVSICQNLPLRTQRAFMNEVYLRINTEIN
jgi:transposase